MIVATAGHVDHGKTQLVKALTGVDTDTLAEEKRRGLSIDIGFAYLPVEGQHSIGFIDVPGHNRFIKNALCGLTAANYVLLVVAADDGLMPQTLEHLSIIDLLNVENGTVVISKIDLVDSERVKHVKNSIRHRISNTSLRHWQVFPVSSITSWGIDVLSQHLIGLAHTTGKTFIEEIDKYNFRLSVDRVFEKKGAGLIVTGTIQSGSIELGKQITVAGTDMELRVRDLRIHNRTEDRGQQGQRCAMNLAGKGLHREKIKRGSWVVNKAVAEPVTRFDAHVRVPGDSPCTLKHWSPVHLHLAAFETTARVALLEKAPIKPGQSGLVQVVCQHSTVAAFGDDFILRDVSAQHTLGGGQVIDIFPPRRGRARPHRINYLKKNSPADTQSAFVGLLESCAEGIDIDRFVSNRNLVSTTALAGLQTVDMKLIQVGKQEIGFSTGFADQHFDSIAKTLMHHCQNHIVNSGMPESELRQQACPGLSRQVFKGFLHELVRQSLIRNDPGGYSVVPKVNGLADETVPNPLILSSLTDAGLRGMTMNEMCIATGLTEKQLKTQLAISDSRGFIVKLSSTLWILPNCLHQLQTVLAQLANNSEQGLFTVAEFRDACGIGRNRCIEILECFDARGFTKRYGKDRLLVERPVFKTGGGR